MITLYYNDYTDKPQAEPDKQWMREERLLFCDPINNRKSYKEYFKYFFNLFL